MAEPAARRARIYGIETEYGVAYEPAGGRQLSAEEISRYLFRSVVEWGHSSNVFLTNGARLYLDVGSHPEYATAEELTPYGATRQDAAGEALLNDLTRDAEAQLRDTGVGGRVFLFKNNVDAAGNSYGCHENYLIRRTSEFRRLTETLLPFLVTRQLVVGGGHATADCYTFSARAEHLWEGVSSATTRSRPLINTRDEPHADPERYRRLHVISGDSTVAQPTTELKMAMVGLVLDLIEQGVPLSDRGLANPIAALRATSRDLSGNTRLDLAAGGAMTALEVQRELLAKVAALVARGDTTVGERAEWAVELWSRGLDAVEQGRPELVDRELDWAIKRRLIDRFRARSGAEWGDPRITRLELAFHDILPERGLAPKLVASGAMVATVPDAEVRAAMTEPPHDTRARLRGRFVAAARAADINYSVDWVHLRLNAAGQSTIVCKDPFLAEDERVDAVIDRLATGAL